MANQLTVLVVVEEAMGPLNACIGISEQLRNRGHKVVFAVPDGLRNKLSPIGFTEEWYSPKIEEESKDEAKLQIFTEMASKMAPAFQDKPEKQIETLYLPFWAEFYRQAQKCEPRLREIVAKVKPDVIIIDALVHQPAVMDAGIPWVYSISLAPLGISKKNVPPAFMGFPTDSANSKLSQRCAELFKSAFHEITEDFKSWIVQRGGPLLEHDQAPLVVKFSPYANIYMYPEELDYTDLRPTPPNFHRFDTFMRSSSDDIFEIPDELKNKPGKLIYFSMGTIGCSELVMMKRLVSVFAKSPHRFIISKGPLGDQLELADNMWGAASVPQVKVIPRVDLVISHGGNNTLTETFYFGKPILVIPLFADQIDNAQRVAEKGLGLRLHPYDSTEEELLGAIEKILGDKELAVKMSEISTRIQASNSQGRAADLIEKVATMRL